MQGRPAGALPDLPSARRKRGIDRADRRWLCGGSIPPGGQDQRAGALLGGTYPPRLEDGCGEPAAYSEQLHRASSGDRSGGGGTEITGASKLASIGLSAVGLKDVAEPALSHHPARRP